MSEKFIYDKKRCTFCGKGFKSPSRGTRYCSPKCQRDAQISNKREDYKENREFRRVLDRAYPLAHLVADLFKIPRVCNYLAHSYKDACVVELHLHHRDRNPFNNSPDNLEWLCIHHHKVCHNGLELINMVTLYNKCVEGAVSEDDDKKHLKMVALFKAGFEKKAIPSQGQAFLPLEEETTSVANTGVTNTTTNAAGSEPEGGA